MKNLHPPVVDRSRIQQEIRGNPRAKIFPIDRAHRVEMETDDTPPLRMVDQNRVELLGHDVVTCPIRVFRTRDTNPVPRLRVNLANAVVWVRVQGTVPTLAVTFFVE